MAESCEKPCKVCKALSKFDAKFCTECGALFTCCECNASLAPTAKFCHQCGTRVHLTSSVAVGVAEVDSTKSLQLNPLHDSSTGKPDDGVCTGDSETGAAEQAVKTEDMSSEHKKEEKRPDRDKPQIQDPGGTHSNPTDPQNQSCATPTDSKESSTGRKGAEETKPVIEHGGGEKAQGSSTATDVKPPDSPPIKKSRNSMECETIDSQMTDGVQKPVKESVGGASSHSPITQDRPQNAMGQESDRTPIRQSNQPVSDEAAKKSKEIANQKEKCSVKVEASSNTTGPVTRSQTQAQQNRTSQEKDITEQSVKDKLSPQHSDGSGPTTSTQTSAEGGNCTSGARKGENDSKDSASKRQDETGNTERSNASGQTQTAAGKSLAQIVSQDKGEGTDVDSTPSLFSNMNRKVTDGSEVGPTGQTEFGGAYVGAKQADRGSGNTNESDKRMEGGVPYRKQDKPPDEYHPAQTKKTKKTAGDNEFGKEDINVCFHVVVSKDFKFDDKKHQFQLRSETLFGEWTNVCCKLKLERYLDKDLAYMTVTVPVRKALLAHGTHLFYKYLCFKPDKDEPFLWEYVYYKVNGAVNRDRSFFIPPIKLKEEVVWHVYDGVSHSEPDKNLLQQFVSFIIGDHYKTLMKEAKVAARAMIPKPDLEHSTAGAILDSLEDFKTQYRKQFFKGDGCTFFEEAFKEVITEYAYNILDNAATKSEPTLIQAVIVLMICSKNGLDWNKEDIRTALLRNFRKSLFCKDQVTETVAAFETHFAATHKSFFIEKLAIFLTDIAPNKDVDWIFAIPWIHFISGASRPNIQPRLERNHTNDAWWGIKDLKKAVDKLKDVLIYNDEVLPKMLDAIRPVVDVDPLLQRTFMALLSVRHLKSIVPGDTVNSVVRIANIVYFAKTREIKNINPEELHSLLDDVNMKIKSEGNTRRTKLAVDDCVVECVIAKELLYEVGAAMRSITYPTNYEWGVLVATAKTVGHVLRKTECLACSLDNSVPSTEQPALQRVKEYWSDMCLVMKEWIFSIRPSGILEYRWPSYYISSPVWYDLMSSVMGIPTSLGYKDDEDYWLSSFSAVLTEFLRSQSSRDMIVAFCVMDYSDKHQKIEFCFSKVALDMVEKARKCDMESIFGILSYNRLDTRKFSEIISKLLLKDWPTESDDLSLLRHALTWPTLSRYFQICRSGEKAELLSENCAFVLTQMRSFIQNTWENIKAGVIPLPLLDLILEHSSTYCELIRLVFNSAALSQDPVTEVIERRRGELQEFRELKKSLGVFYSYCDSLKQVDVFALGERLRRNESEMQLADICIPFKFEREKDTVKPKIQLVPFDVPADVQYIIPKLCSLMPSLLFKLHSDTYCQQAVKLGSNPLPMTAVVDSVFRPTFITLKDLMKKLETGTITLQQVDNLFCHFHNAKEIENELQKLCDGSQSWFAPRIEQIEKYKQMNTYRKGAEIVNAAREKFGLNGNFDVLDILLSRENNKSCPLRDLNMEVFKAGEELKDLTEKNSECIESFHKCHELVTWLKDNAKDIKEIKTLVDLAMMSAQGQGAMEIQKVSSLHAAATGYAPLIYDLPQEADFKLFFKQCQLVWQALAKDPHLPEHLEGTNRMLQWLKNVKESHGSVEMNALTQASNINSRGTYKVGYLGENDNTKRIENTVVLILKKSGDNEKRKYNLAELCELQSKLMLVAGKAEQGNEEVERFVQIHDGVTRLANAFVKINKVGCVLFRHWNATFKCSPNEKIQAEVDFGNKSSERTILASKYNQTNNVLDEICRVCEFLEGCIEDWTSEISKWRTEFYFLNHYTTEQIVLLCEELAKFMQEDSSHSPRLFSLLTKVNPVCNEENLKFAVHKAFEDLKPRQDVEHSTEQSLEETDDIQRKFIEAMKEASFSDSIIQRALTELDDLKDLTNGYLWCMEQANDTDLPEAETLVEEATPQQLSMKESVHPETLDELASRLLFIVDKDISRDSSLKSRLTHLWTQYITRAHGTSLSDFLSGFHLGYILEQLYPTGVEEVIREFPSSCQPGKANLIVCPEEEVLKTCLSLYMEGKGSTQSFPTDAEVLLCKSETSAEEVELLLRRALGMHKEGKIFCLVNADRLTYDVGVHMEKFYEVHRKGNADFHLVIICAKEREDKSTVASAFERDRVKAPILKPLVAIQSYIKRNLHVTDEHNSLASLDSEGCSVRVIKSRRAGVGKSLKATRLAERAKDLIRDNSYIRVNLHSRTLDVQDILDHLLPFTTAPEEYRPHLFHLDIAHEVQGGIDDFLFSLVILGSVTDAAGYVWRRTVTDNYIIESMPIMLRDHKTRGKEGQIKFAHEIFQILPNYTCWSPRESREILAREHEATPSTYKDYKEHDQLMDEQEFSGETWQRVYQYLSQHENDQEFSVDPNVACGNPLQCIEVMLRHCGLQDPSWAELRHFVWFLSIQLSDADTSVFCGPILKDDLPGFKKFVVKGMIQMSRDFATRSLKLAEETPLLNEVEEVADIEHFQIRRRWESCPHPYVFFNADRNSMTFLGFNIQQNGDMVDLQTNTLLERNVMPKPLQDALRRNFVPLNENFDGLHRIAKIDKIHRIMGIPEGEASYPDESYVLTSDNVKKIMAIYMRFRCGIPVIIMGETGCGKTRLVKFMCDLQKPQGVKVTNMILMKVHGGTTSKDIEQKMEKAVARAKKNLKIAPYLDTILFFDEANTTEEIGRIKRVMVDNDDIVQQHGLKIVAACNPYRKHSDEMIKRLEKAGLGYHIKAEDTKDKLGQVPMRRLVYRVQALPQSLLPLVWDFGQLDINTETAYIQQMIKKCIDDRKLPNVANIHETMSAILATSQDFMRHQQDECRFVSLRDVERVLKVTCWFYQHSDKMFPRMEELFAKKREEDIIIHGASDDEAERDTDDDSLSSTSNLDAITRSMVLALGVCYHACLNKREEYRQCIAPYFRHPLTSLTADVIEQEISGCQEVFLDELVLGENIAKNQALKENVFMMIVCIELRIPLFLVGKPGSSKSLAKTIVADAMQGEASRSSLFKEFKSVHIVSYQCSPLATPQGIVGTFKQCADLQEKKDLDKFVSVVVLDEVGLAEDSPRMPLKALHPLLEDGCADDEDPQPYKKVAFIGISNWALDPAKMNRGILVQRDVPDVEELRSSAMGICSSDDKIKTLVQPMVEPMAKAYLELYNSALELREFFGLRDFYSIIKMVYGFAKRSGKPPTWHELQHSILRNFSGFDQVKPVEVFKGYLTHVDKNAPKCPEDPDCTPAGLINACLFGKGLKGFTGESRYLLILTENYAALKILQQQLLRDNKVQYIFGSSFPKDQEYTQVCRNINKIKICMETGQTVVLMNLENLYESLYDALNQYYVYLGGQRFVDLGLGTHRVKCKVHRDFRLIVVADREVVIEKFPIPLINRLEKHTLTMETILTSNQLQMAEDLQRWAEAFLSFHKGTLKVEDIFIGYDKDTPASIVLYICTHIHGEVDEGSVDVLEECKKILLQCATPESIVRLKESRLREEAEEIEEWYYKEQSHSSIKQFIKNHVISKTEDDVFAQVTTHSKLLSINEIQKTLTSIGTNIYVQRESLHAFDTEQQFCQQLKGYFQRNPVDSESCSLLLIQCDSGDKHGALIASARYSIVEAYRDYSQQSTFKRHVIFIIQLPRKHGGCFTGFEAATWLSYHVDTLLPDETVFKSEQGLCEKPISSLLNVSVDTVHEKDHSIKENPSSIDEEDIYSETSSNTNDAVTNALENLTINEDIRPNVDIGALLKTCLHGAAAMLEDDVTQADRKPERVRLLLRMFDDQSGGLGSKLQKVFSSRIKLLQKDKENKCQGHLASRWVETAASLNSIVNTGTFRNSLQSTLEQTIAPLLAGIISYCDSNNNLDLITITDDPEHWLHLLWMSMLAEPLVTRLQYTDLRGMRREQELERFQVRNHGAQGVHFHNHLPFSWTFKNRIDLLIHTALQNPDEESTAAKVERLFCSGEEGKLIQNVDRKDFIRRYTHDFVRMVYTCRSYMPEEEYMLIENAMTQLMEHVTSNTEQVSPLAGLMEYSETRLHFLHMAVKPRLDLFASAVAGCPDIVNTLCTKTENPLMKSDFSLDVQSLVIALEMLVDSSNKLNTEKGVHNWLASYETYRSFTERMFDFFLGPVGYNIYTLDDLCKNEVIECRNMWSRICTMQLFVSHVCTPFSHKEKVFTVDLCQIIWKIIGDQPNFKEMKTFRNLERILQLCSGLSYKHCIGEAQKCDRCENVDELYRMKCKDKHSVCQSCFDEFWMSDLQQCPRCRHTLPQNFKPELSNPVSEDKLRAYKNYRHRCNTFFMEVVSRMSFAGDKPPSDDLVQLLLSYVTKEPISDPALDSGTVKKLFSKKMSMFDVTIDPTPAVRSLLLQLLLRSNVTSVQQHLQKFLSTGEIILGGDASHKLKLCLLFIHCVEDAKYSEYKQVMNDTEAISRVRRLLSCSHNDLLHQDVEYITKLEAIANVRLGLSLAAEWMHKVYCTKEKVSPVEVVKLAEVAAKLCENPGLQWPRMYLIKVINKRYGLDALKHMSAQRKLDWMLPDEAKSKPGQNSIPPDGYLVYDEMYSQIKRKLKAALFSSDFEETEAILKNLKGQKSDIMFLISLTRVVRIWLIENNIRALPGDKQELLQNFIPNVSGAKVCELSSQVIKGNMGYLKSPVQTGNMIEELLGHFWVLLNTTDDSNKWLAPFITLFKTPQKMQGVFLPGFPEDHYEEIARAIEDVRKQGGDGGNPTLYFCPNSHPYIIGNCGRPASEAKCECGLRIGGTGYKLADGNVLANANINRNRVFSGHCLGDATKRSNDPTPERSLSPMETSILLLLTHMALYLCACEHQGAVAQIIHPIVHEPQVYDFLYRHMRHDLVILTKVLNRSPEECCLLMNHLLVSMYRARQDKGTDASLMSQKQRRQWEKRFRSAVLNTSLKDMNKTVENYISVMQEDLKEEADPLLRFLYGKTNEDATEGELDCIEQSALVWQLRARLSVDCLEQVIQDHMTPEVREGCEVLCLFIKQEHKLRALRFLPDILRLQGILLRRFHNSIDRAEANTETVYSLLQQLQGPVRDEHQRLIQSFLEALQMSKQHIQTGKNLDPNLLNLDLTNLDEIPLGMLLPSLKGYGVVAIALVEYLASVQNDFLENYAGLVKKSGPKTLSLRECSAANLIAYDAERELLPIFIACRNYTIYKGKDTEEEYDFVSLQSQIQDRFIIGRTFLRPIQVDTIIFREDFTNATVFTTLQEKIPQVELDATVAQQISGEYAHVADITTSLSVLDIAIGYLVSIESDPTMLFTAFLTEILQLKTKIHSQQAERHTQLQHVQSLWILLSQLKARRLYSNGHDPFDEVDQQYKDELSTKQEAEMRGFLTRMQHISGFMAQLYECILLQITDRSGSSVEPEEETQNYSYPLGYSLHEYIESKEGEVLWNDLPDDLQYKHSIAVWKFALTLQQETARP